MTQFTRRGEVSPWLSRGSWAMAKNSRNSPHQAMTLRPAHCLINGAFQIKYRQRPEVYMGPKQRSPKAPRKVPGAEEVVPAAVLIENASAWFTKQVTEALLLEEEPLFPNPGIPGVQVPWTQGDGCAMETPHREEQGTTSLGAISRRPTQRGDHARRLQGCKCRPSGPHWLFLGRPLRYSGRGPLKGRMAVNGTYHTWFCDC
jgi:hypothetical protein